MTFCLFYDEPSLVAKGSVCFMIASLMLRKFIISENTEILHIYGVEMYGL